jgi:hypothetical protein
MVNFASMLPKQSLENSRNSSLNIAQVLAHCEAMLREHDFSCLHGKTLSTCSKCQPHRISNIGRLDKLGSFRLESSLEQLLVEDDNAWYKLKSDSRSKQEREAMQQASKIITDVIQEVVDSYPPQYIPRSFLDFLATPI